MGTPALWSTIVSYSGLDENQAARLDVAIFFGSPLPMYVLLRRPPLKIYSTPRSSSKYCSAEYKNDDHLNSNLECSSSSRCIMHPSAPPELAGPFRTSSRITEIHR